MIRVKFIGGVRPADTSEVWGGSKATFYALAKCFEGSEKINFECKARNDFSSYSEAYEFLFSGDISHVDDLGVLETFYINGSNPPDVAGPIVRSPIKEYRDGRKVKYPKEWFYKSKVIRLNYAEERNSPELVTLIRHGVDTEMLKPSNKTKKFILWAGNIHRYAKNFEMMNKVMEITALPKGYEWKVLHNYKVKDYWDILDETAILINTSRYESFCCALFEARAKGVATIQPKLLNGKGIHENAPVQVEYNPEAYRNKILELLENKEYIRVGKECREYCEKTASLKIMGSDLTKIYIDVYNSKRHS